MRTLYVELVFAASRRLFFFYSLSLAEALPVVVVPKPLPNGFLKMCLLLKRDTPTTEPKSFITPAIVTSLVLFIIFAGIFIILFVFSSEIRAFLYEKLARRQKEFKPEASEVEELALGFRSVGLTEAVLETAKQDQEKQVTRPRLFIEIPIEPPSLVLKHHSESPLSPIRLHNLQDEEPPGDANLFSNGSNYLSLSIRSTGLTVTDSGESSDKNYFAVDPQTLLPPQNVLSRSGEGKEFLSVDALPSLLSHAVDEDNNKVDGGMHSSIDVSEPYR